MIGKQSSVRKRLQMMSSVMPKIHYTRFPVSTSRWNVIWETTQQTQRTLPVPTCYRFVVDLLWGSCQLVMDLLWGNWCNGFWP